MRLGAVRPKPGLCFAFGHRPRRRRPHRCCHRSSHRFGVRGEQQRGHGLRDRRRHMQRDPTRRVAKAHQQPSPSGTGPSQSASIRQPIPFTSQTMEPYNGAIHFAGRHRLGNRWGHLQRRPTVRVRPVPGTVTVGAGPLGIGVDPTTNSIYVANTGAEWRRKLCPRRHGVTDRRGDVQRHGPSGLRRRRGDGHRRVAPFGIAVNRSTNEI